MTNGNFCNIMSVILMKVVIVMRTIEDIRRKVKYVKPIMGSTYGAEIETSRWRGTVVFGFNEGGWEHVSVSPYRGKLPTWDDMCEIKDIFWDDEEEVIQIHPKKSKYVNIKDNCLHLWRHTSIELPR